MNITPYILALLVLIFGLIALYLIPILKANTTKEQRKEILQIVKIAVEAAEQLFNSDEGEAKKKYVETYLLTKGFNLNLSELDMLIESEVLKLHNQLSND